MGEVTSTLTVQVPAVAPLPAGMDRVVGSEIVFVPALALTAPEPAHVVEAFGVGAITTPEGSVSTSAAESVAADAFGFVSVMVSVEVPLAAMVDGTKPFARLGVAALTVSVALAA